jgi:hypothetical protein
LNNGVLLSHDSGKIAKRDFAECPAKAEAGRLKKRAGAVDLLISRRGIPRARGKNA